MLTADILDFEAPFQCTAVQGNRSTPRGATRTALLLHGGGASTAAGFRELRQFLHVRCIETVAFDCVGHGCTGGSQLGTTLEERVQQTLAVIDAQCLESESLAVIGFSMGAYVAAKVATEVGATRLCLAIPAAYAAQAYRAPFGIEFTQILRTPRSWESSDAFDLMRDYKGHLLVVSAEEDRIIPSEIPRMYASGGDGRASTVHDVVRHAGHNLSEHYEREPQTRDATYVEIAALCLR